MSEVGVAYVRLLPSARGFGAAAAGELRGEVGGAAEQVSKSMSDKFTAAGARMTSVGKGMTLGLTLPIVGFGTAALSAAGNFEAGMKRVGVLSGATGDELAAMEDLARDLGSTTMFSATEAAEALGFLAMAGFDASEGMTALPGVLDLAAAGQLDLATTADIASNALSGFGLEAGEIDRIADVMAQTISSANTDMNQLGEAFSFVAPIAASAGLSVEETAAAIGVLGNAGIQGSRAGTALGGAITRLLTPSGAAADTIERLGLEVTDAQGNMLPMVDIVRQLETAGADTADMMTIFGQRAGPAMAALVSQGADALGELTEANMESAGVAAEIAGVEMEGFQGAIKGLSSAFEGLMLAIADSGLLEWATEAVGKITDWIRGLSDANPEMLKWGTIIAGAVAAAGPLLLIFGKAATMLGSMTGGVGGLSGAMAKLGGVLKFALGPWGLIIGLLVAAFLTSEEFREAIMGLLGIIMSLVGDLLSALMPALSAIIDAIVPLVSTLAEALAPILTIVAELLGELLLALMPLIMALLDLLIPVIEWVAEALGWLIENAIVPAAEWLGEKLPPFIETLGEIFAAVFGAIAAVVSWWWNNVVKRVWDAVVKAAKVLWTGIKRYFGFWKGIFTNVVGWVKGMWTRAKSWLDKLIKFVKGLPGKIKSGLSNLKDRFLAPFRAAFNAVAGLWNRTIGSWSITVPSWVPGIGGNGWSMPRIPTAARGGVFDPQRGGVLAVLAEAGVREYALPEPDLDRLLHAAVRAGDGAASPAAAMVTIDATGLPRALAEWLRGAVRTKGAGSVQRFAGQGARR